jgi:di/tricarboxylate transporter
MPWRNSDGSHPTAHSSRKTDQEAPLQEMRRCAAAVRHALQTLRVCANVWRLSGPPSIEGMDNWQAWFTVAVLGLVFFQLAFTRVPADFSLIGGVALLVLTGILPPEDALKGLANEGMVTVALLFVVSAGMTETGGITWIAERMFGHPKSSTRAIARLAIPAATASAFMNNTPLVAMLIPAVNDWAKQIRVAASKLMIPLSYAAILGGTCTLIGTSTNIVVDGLVQEAAQTDPAMPAKLGMFDITWVGLPACIVGLAFIIGLSRWLLPDRRPPISNLDDPRQYTVEMVVSTDSPLAGKTIEDAGLRHLQGVFLAEINRDDHVLPAVSPQERLRAGDVLVFVGVVDSVVDLRKIRGLAPATDQVAKIAVPSRNRCLIEAVVSNSCPIVGKTIRDGRFRTRYDAAVIAVARNGERINKKIGDIVLEPGDTLLLESHPSFADRQKNSRDFFLVSRLENSAPPQHEKAIIALAILLGLVIALTSSLVPTVVAALGAAVAMVLTGCTSIAGARRAIDWETLLAIAASFGIAEALQVTKAAAAIGGSVIEMAAENPRMSLAIVYAVTLIVTELITNNAAAILMFPLAMSTAAKLDVSYTPFIIAVMMAASAGFATPIGYQTNLMVYGPGGYRFSDYLKIGVPLDILIGIVTVVLAPEFFPF